MPANVLGVVYIAEISETPACSEALFDIQWADNRDSAKRAALAMHAHFLYDPHALPDLARDETQIQARLLLQKAEHPQYPYNMFAKGLRKYLVHAEYLPVYKVTAVFRCEALLHSTENDQATLTTE